MQSIVFSHIMKNMIFDEPISQRYDRPAFAIDRSDNILADTTRFDLYLDEPPHNHLV